MVQLHREVYFRVMLVLGRVSQFQHTHTIGKGQRITGQRGRTTPLLKRVAHTPLFRAMSGTMFVAK